MCLSEGFDSETPAVFFPCIVFCRHNNFGLLKPLASEITRDPLKGAISLEWWKDLKQLMPLTSGLTSINWWWFCHIPPSNWKLFHPRVLATPWKVNKAAQFWRKVLQKTSSGRQFSSSSSGCTGKSARFVGIAFLVTCTLPNHTYATRGETWLGKSPTIPEKTTGTHNTSKLPKT